MVFKKSRFILLVLFTIALSLNAYSAVLVNEIMYDPSPSQGSYAFNEWIEIFNNGTSSVDLTNWMLCGKTLLKGYINHSDSAYGVHLNTTFILNPSNYALITDGGATSGTDVYNNFNVDLSALALHVDVASLCGSLDDSGDIINISNGTYTQLVNYTPFISLANGNGKTLLFYKGNFTESAFVNGTPGASNDQFAPDFNKWINPSKNNSFIDGLFNITVNITDVTNVSSALVNFNSTNFSMNKNGDIWCFLWNTSLYTQKPYDITVFFNDSYGQAGIDMLFNITVNNSPRIDSFSPSNLIQTITENFILNFSINASDPDDNLLNFSWFVDNVFNSSNLANFSYMPGFSDNGTHTINATIKDASSNQVSLKWTVIVTNVNRAPVLEAIPNKIGFKNINLSFNITATDLDNDILTFSSNHSGIAISKLNNSLATISWRPTNMDLGSNTINFTVSDGSLIDSKLVLITVNFTNNTAPNITSLPKTNAVKNEKYVYDVDAIDPDNDVLNFSLRTNATGMLIDSSTGIITFTPSSLGFFIVNISVSDFIDLSNQSYNLTVKEGSKLKITSVDAKINGKKSSNIDNNTKISKEAEPSSSIEFKIKVKNDFSSDEDLTIEDIKVKATIEDIDDGDNLEEESKDFNLRAQDDKTATLKFNMPLNVDEGTFDVLIEAEGEDENGTSQEQHFKIELEVEKKKHDLRFLDFSLSPAIIRCNNVLNINYEIINIGQEDEENSALEIKNNDLGLNIIEKNIAIDSGTEGNAFSSQIKIKIDNKIEKGTYPIIANLYSDDNKLRDAKTAELKVEDCIKKAEQEEAVLVAPAEEQPKEITAIKETIETPTIRISFKEADSNIRLLVLSTLVFTIFFVFTAIVLYVRF